MRRNNCRSNKFGLYFAAFGLGMLVSLICPNSVTLVILSMTIVFLGISICR